MSGKVFLFRVLDPEEDNFVQQGEGCTSLVTNHAVKITQAEVCARNRPVTIYMLLHGTLLCKKIARAPGGHKIYAH